jgi:excisionase family DNA binding protein
MQLSSIEYAKARYSTVAEVAQALRVSNMTVYRLIKSGEMSAVGVGKSYRLRDEDVERYLAEGLTEAG